MTNLTPRERQVCDLLVLGKTSKEVARDLGLSWRTVDDHRHQIFVKYEVVGIPLLIRKVYGLGAPPSQMQAAE